MKWVDNYKSNKAGLEALARGPAVQRLVRSHANAIAARAGDGFEASFTQGRRRFVGIVFANTFSSKRREARDNVLVRVLG